MQEQLPGNSATQHLLLSRINARNIGNLGKWWAKQLCTPSKIYTAE